MGDYAFLRWSTARLKRLFPIPVRASRLSTSRRSTIPFFTTKNMLLGERRGTGLGLSVSYGIIQEHAGKIHVESAVGSGTTFHLEFPLLRNSVHA